MTVFWFPVSEKWGHFLGIEDEVQQIFFIIDTFKNVKNNPPIGPLIKIRGSKMILAEQALRWAQRKFNLVQFWLRNLTFKMSFFSFFEKVEKWPFCFADFTMKTQFPEKMEYTTRKPMENATKLSTQIFDFRNFVTEIFHHTVPYYKKTIFRFYDKNLRFRRSLNKPSQLLKGSTDFQYQYVKIKGIKARKV